MKRIAVVTDTGRTRLGEALQKNLEEVLGDRVELQGHAFDRLEPGEWIEAEVVLAMHRRRALSLRNHVAEARSILVVQRTIRESEIYPIFAIPPGTRVLVVNDHPETTLETVTLLQHLEINHLQFVPFEEGMDCQDLAIAITPGERERVPAHIGTIIDLGHRCIDISTFIEIIHRLGLSDREVDRRLLRYSERIVTLDSGVDRQYKALFLRNTQLDTVINLSHEGILLLDTGGKVALCNRALAGMLGLEGEVTGTEAFPAEIQEVVGRKTGREWIVEHRGRSLVVTRQPIEHFGEPAGSCFNFQEVTYIRQLEQNLSRKLLEKGLTARYTFADVLTQAPKMQQCVDLARRIAGSDFTVLIQGESGTGKELLAQSIHRESSRCKQPFVAVNCAAVPEHLLESELFGYEGGSFTGALKDGKTGLFEQAHHGTVFLDEIADMPLVLQAKLLRVLQERQIMRIGSQRVINVNIRVIAATNHDLRERIRTGRFREDLYYRLNALPLVVPPLRERTGDIFPLLTHFLSQHQRRGLQFSPEAREILLRYPWPGNIRELNNVASYLSFMSRDLVSPDALPHYLLGGMTSFERELELLASRCRLDLAQAVLAVLSGRKRSAGRRTILETLTRTGHASTEGEIRHLLALLNQAGLVRSHPGRAGTDLTARGAALLLHLSGRPAAEAPSGAMADRDTGPAQPHHQPPARLRV